MDNNRAAAVGMGAGHGAKRDDSLGNRGRARARRGRHEIKRWSERMLKGGRILFHIGTWNGSFGEGS